MLLYCYSTIVIPMPTTADEEESDAWDPLSAMGTVRKETLGIQVLPEHGDSGLSTIETPAINWVPSIQTLEQMDTELLLRHVCVDYCAGRAKERCGENHRRSPNLH